MTENRQVIPSKERKTRSWWSNVCHLEGRKMKVVAVQGEYILFLDFRGYQRRWHKSNLSFVNRNMVNK